MGCRHPSPALAAGPGLGYSRNPYPQPCQLRPQGRKERSRVLGLFPLGQGPPSCVRTGCCLAGALHLAGHRQEAGGKALDSVDPGVQ